MQSYPLLKVEDPNCLLDADWTAIGRLQRAYSLGGSISLSKALDKLVTSDPDRAARVLEALSSPELAPRDTYDDMPELLRDLEMLADDPLQSAIKSRASRAAAIF